MYVYNPNLVKLSIGKDKEKIVLDIFDQIGLANCFITGSFLYKDDYQDIDVFVITRSKKKIKIDIPKVKITVIDFNDLHSLFFHSISKCCISKNVLPNQCLKVTLSDFWGVINEAIPTLINQKDKFHKSVRFLILYTYYFLEGRVLGSFELSCKINGFKDYKEILNFVEENVPVVVNKKIKKSYLKRFFYTQAGFYKDMKSYSSQRFLYNLTHLITRGGISG
jgi:hypothetical protein